MTSGHNLNFTNQDLRNRSFKGLDLRGANFSGSDLRGCDFSCALLVGANFERVRTGITIRRVGILVTVAMIVAFLMASAVTRTVFSSISEPVGGRNWSYILALLVSLSMSGAASGVRIVIASQFRPVAFVFSAAASGALLGFFYGGIAANQNPQVAIASAVVGGVLIGVVSLRVRTGAVGVAIAIAAAVAGYGLAFWLWARALAFLSTQRLVWGIFLSVLSLAYIGLTISSLSLALKEIKKSSGTSFRHADLTHALFDNAQFPHTDFSDAIGYLGK